MELARGRGRVKSLDSVAGGSCSRSSKDGLIYFYNKSSVQVIVERRITKISDVVKVLEYYIKHVLCLNKGFIALYLEKRGGSEKVHTETVAAAACGQILPVVQHPPNNFCVCLSQALLSTDGVSGEVRQAGRNMLQLYSGFEGLGNFFMLLVSVCYDNQMEYLGLTEQKGVGFQFQGVRAGMATQVNSEISLKQRKIVGIVVIINCLGKTYRTDSCLQEISAIPPHLLLQAGVPGSFTSHL